MRRTTFAILSTVSVAALTASPAFAQTGAPIDSAPEKVAEDQELTPDAEMTNAEGEPVDEGDIVVTGSRIRRDNFNTPSPVTILTRDDTVLAGATGTAETLQSASITSGTSQISSGFLGFLSEGGQGANTVGLRGLGSQRTLTLLNGRRLAPAGVGSQLVAADLNVLPTAVVQRIEVLREGASAIYGSDAIGGVINVITDTKLDGVVLDAFTDLPLDLIRQGAGQTWRASLTAGKRFERGYILASVEYRQRNGVRFQDDPALRCPRALFFQNGQEVGQIDPETGELACFAFGPNGSQGSGIASGYGLYGIYFNAPYNNIYSTGRIGFANGNINTPQITNNFLLRPIREEPQLQSHVVSPVKTYTAFVAGGYELGALGDAELYGEVLFTRRKSFQDGAVQFSVDTLQLDPNIEIYGGTNYATGQPISNYGAPNGFPQNYRESPFFPTAFTNFYVNRFNPFIIPDQLQRATQKVDFVRANGGLRGSLGLSDWRYDANYQLSRTRSNEFLRNPTVETASNVLMTALAPAGTPSNLIVTAPAGSVRAGENFTCASNVTGGVYNGGLCAPLNIFDPNILIGGDISPATYDYLYVPQTQRTRFNQDTFSLIFDGTLFNLPAGPLKAAIGFEYRRDKIVNTPSADAQAGLLYNRTNEGITQGSDNVKEVFVELNLPILRDRPFAHNLELSASGRYTDYKSYGSDFVYRLNAQYAPVEAVRFRASYGTNFRAPNLFEQFVNNQTGFFGGGSDPCDSFATLSEDSNTYINCLAELTPILDNPATPGNEALNYFNASSILVNTTGGKDNLEAEKAKSWGVGVVLTAPRELADLSFAVDYFDTEVKDEVSTLGLSILNLCYNEDPATFPAGNYCPLINGRNPLGTAYPGTIISFQNPYLNLARQVVRGIDFNARYATPLAGGRFVTQLQATRMLEQSLEIFSGSGLFDYNGTPGYPGFGSGPKWTGALDTRFETGPVTVRWGVEYIGSQSAYELVEEVNYPTNGGTGVAGQPYTEDLEVEAYWEHSLSLQYKWEDVAQITVGVKNLFNEEPPGFSDSLDPFGQYFRVGNYFGGGPYDYLGRSVFLNITRSF